MLLNRERQMWEREVEGGEESHWRQVCTLTLTLSLIFCMILGKPLDLSSSTKTISITFPVLPRFVAVNRLPESVDVEVLFKLERIRCEGLFKPGGLDRDQIIPMM